MGNNLEAKIRELCTYHSEGGTSGYNLSEQQFQKLFTLIRSEVREIGEDLKSHMLGVPEQGMYKLGNLQLDSGSEDTYEVVGEIIDEIISRHLGEETNTNQEGK